MNQLSPRKKLIIIIVSVVIVMSSLVGLAFLLWNQLSPSSNNGSNTSSATISNYGSTVQNISPDEQTIVEQALYQVIKLNSPNTDPDSLTDISIRDGSYNQSYDSNSKLYTSTYLVDIPSLKQSYKISDKSYSDDSSYSQTGDYTTTALCPRKDELKYGDFKCKDRISVEDNIPYSDPIESILPHNDSDFTASLDGYDTNLNKISVKILLLIDTSIPGNNDATAAQYKDEVTQWLKSQNLNPDDYNLEFK